MSKLALWLVLGGLVWLVRAHRRRTAAQREADEDLAHLIATQDDAAPDDAVSIDAAMLAADDASNPARYDDPRAARGSGELYDVRVMDAVDTDLPDDDRAFDEGQNWLEHLQASASEYGPQPEHVLDVVDDSDPHGGSHPTDTRDRPIADRGSGGPRGL